jgi:hypothetical protein
MSSNLSVYGGYEWLYPDLYKTMCLDFNGNANLSFRSNGTRGDFEVYNTRATGTYNNYVPQLPGGEATVSEAYPYQFYIDSRSQEIDTRHLSGKDTLTVHFFPKEVMREFTFLIYDVIGAKYINTGSGAISGMSGSYFPASGRLAEWPSTLLFKRVEAIIDGQKERRWSEKPEWSESKTWAELFSLKDPQWNDSDTLKGWTRDWITGQFVTFGPLDRTKHHFRLTIEAISKASNHYYGAWGYWFGQWEGTVAAQIDSAMGRNQTWEEQVAWRQRNGGFDIVLYNNDRLTIRDDNTISGGVPDGGFQVDIDDWGDIVGINLSANGSQSPSFPLRSDVHTYSSVANFVVNGVWTEGSDLNCIFNQQIVYKPEDAIAPNTVWNYHPKKYWPSSGKVDFYAYAPMGVQGLVKGLHNNNTDNNQPPVIEYAMPLAPREGPPPGTGEPDETWVSDSQPDLLVAVQQRASPQTTPVPMHFHHAFSRVNVKAKLDKNYGSSYVKVTRVDLRKVRTKAKLELKHDQAPQGTYSIGIPRGKDTTFVYDTSGANKVILWTQSEREADYRFQLLSNSVQIDDYNHYSALSRATEGIFLIPQMATDIELFVEYDVYSFSWAAGEKYEGTTARVFRLPSGFAFEIGRQYDLQVPLDIP